MCGSQAFGTVLPLMGNVLCLRWGKGWLKMQSPWIYGGFRSVRFVTGQWKRGGGDSRMDSALWEENAVSQQTSAFMVKIPDRLNDVPGQWSGVGRSVWFNEHVSGAHLKRCPHEHGSCYIIHRLYTCLLKHILWFFMKVRFWRFEGILVGFICINTSVNKHGCGF